MDELQCITTGVMRLVVCVNESTQTELTSIGIEDIKDYAQYI